MKYVLLQDSAIQSKRKHKWRHPAERYLEGKWEDQQGQTELFFYTIPEKLLKKKTKIEKIITGMKEISGGSSLVWIEKRIRTILREDWHEEQIGTEWMHMMWKEHCNCSCLVMILPEKELTECLLLAEQIVGNEYGYLNHFLLAMEGDCRRGNENPLQYRFFAHMYQETGLLAEIAADKELEKILRLLQKYGKTVWIDLRKGYRVSSHIFPENTVYLDMTSDPEKERMLYAKRKDIKYISIWKFLDTYGRNRYNMYRCQKV